MLTSNCRRTSWTSPASLLLAFALVPWSSFRCCHGQSPSETALSRARQLIRETPHPFESPNPLAVVRVVNCLHALGKQQAIALLREIAPEERERSFVIDPDDAEAVARAQEYEDTLWDAQRVSTIIPLLFEVVQGDALPPAYWYDWEKRQWSVGCGVLVVQNGIPFNACGVWQLEGSLGTTLPLVEWAAAHGKLRDKPLEPQGDPLQAADVLYFRIIARAVPQFPAQWAQDERGRRQFRRILRDQALDLLPPAFGDRKDLSWDELRKHLAHTGIHWDSETQAFAMGNDPKIDESDSCPK